MAASPHFYLILTIRWRKLRFLEHVIIDRLVQRYIHTFTKGGTDYLHGSLYKMDVEDFTFEQPVCSAQYKDTWEVFSWQPRMIFFFW